MLENVPLFSGLSVESLAEIEQHSSVKAFRKNAIIISQDDKSDSLYVILTGRVKVFVSGEDGREAVLNHQGAGDYFGDLALIDGQPRGRACCVGGVRTVLQQYDTPLTQQRTAATTAIWAT